MLIPQVFSISAGMSIRPTTSVCHSSSPVISLATAFQSRRGGWAEDIGCELVSCDDQGIIRVWQAQSSSSYVDAGVSVKAGVPCCSLAVRKGFVIAAGSDGCIRIYHMVSCTEPGSDCDAGQYVASDAVRVVCLVRRCQLNLSRSRASVVHACQPVLASIIASV